MPMISPYYTILEVLQKWGGYQIATQARVHGILEYQGSCPFCPGSHDSCIVKPSEGTFSHNVRSGGCGRRGDAVDFLMQFLQMNFSQACEELGIDAANYSTTTTSTPVFDDNAPPPLQWQKTAMNFVERAAKFLWTTHPAAQKARSFLLEDQCLTEDILRQKKIGYCPLTRDGRWYGSDPAEGALELWGLSETDINDSKVRDRGTILIPPGIIIPWIQESQEILWKIEVKRFEETDHHRRFRQVAGSKNGLYNTDTIKYDTPLVLVESSLCALSIEQEAGDLVSAVATGGTSGGRNRRFYPLVFSVPNVILQSYDADSKGELGAQYWMPLIGDKGFRYRPELAKDPNDMLKLQHENGNEPILRSWVSWGLEMHELKMHGELQEEIPPKPDPPNASLQRAPITAYASQEALEEFWRVQFSAIENNRPYRPLSPEYDIMKTYRQFYHAAEIGTPDGRGRIWDEKSLYEQVQRGYARVALPTPTGRYQHVVVNPYRETKLYPVEELLPLQKEK